MIRLKNSKRGGITLIALIVTIVVLLILAGITINMVFSNRGVINQAQEAGKAQANAEELDKLKMAILSAQMEGQGKLTTENLNNAIKSTIQTNREVFEMIEEWIYQGYKISSNGMVEKVLPDEYQQVEYIESTGTQYIDTKYMINENFKYKVRF